MVKVDASGLNRAEVLKERMAMQHLILVV